MTEQTQDLHLNYIDKYLINDILKKLCNESFLKYDVDFKTDLDGFMSAIYSITLQTYTPKGMRTRKLIVKLMKGDVSFRETSKSYIQFENEIYIYAKVLPLFAQLLEERKVNDISINNWIAPCYVAKFGYIEGLSTTTDEREAVLVLDNLKPEGYELGNRLYLQKTQLLRMCSDIGEFHAMSYTLKIIKPLNFEICKSGIIPLPFVNDDDVNDDKNNFYRVLYRAAFDRFYDFIERNFNQKGDEKDQKELLDCIRSLKTAYFSEPTRLLEYFRTSIRNNVEDERFAAILHGDYNRNNVLFKERMAASADSDMEMKMIDFQEARFGTPAIDLSFFMYMNSPEEIRENNWMEMLETYHSSMFKTLSKVLKGVGTEVKATNEDEIDMELKFYSFENFCKHFSRYAFYGVMICLHFLPWMLCDEESCSRLSHLFETNIHSEEFHKLSIDAGGDEVNYKIFDIVKHAYKMGYINFLRNSQ